jgi:hypothetical protein
MITKPTKVLCKRTETSGDTFWWDDSVVPPVRHERDNRMLVAGDWYDVVDNPNDSWDEEKRNFTFSIIDNQGNRHLHYMYEQQDMAKWPDICTKYGPRDYAKWFYTPEELIQLENGTFKLEEDIHIRPGNYHWVLTKDDNWIIAKCLSKHQVPGKFYWKMIGTDWDRSSFDFKEIGQQVLTQEKQLEQEEKIKSQNELLTEVFILVDAINKNDTDENYPSVEYVMPFVNKAVDKYFDDSFKYLGELLFNKE